ncbi:MAG: T9SS type A sorting domain-containing protein, partial [Bacteroidetes bacterium]|nr:T9SS type A sorting domain-containing protein [Bacteroidota bacterium]
RSAYTVHVSTARTVARLRLDTRDATLQLGADLTVNGPYTLVFGTLTGSGTLIVEGPLTWDNGTMAGTGTTRANGGADLQGGTLDARRLVIPTGQTATRSRNDFEGANGAVMAIQTGATLDIQHFRNLSIAAGSTSPPVLINRGTVQKTTDSRTVVSWTVENHGTLVAENGRTLRLTGRLNDVGGTYRAAGSDSRLDLWPSNDATFTTNSTLAADPGATLRLSHSSDADTPPALTIEGTVDIAGRTKIGEEFPAVDVTIAAAADVQRLGGEALIIGDRGKLTVEPTAPLTVGRLDLNARGRLTMRGDLTVAGPMTVNNASARFESGGATTVEGALTWKGGTLMGSGSITAAGGLLLTGGAGSASNVKRLDAHRLIIPDGATGTYSGAYLRGGNGAVLDIQPGAVFDIETFSDLNVSAQGDAIPTIINRGTLEKTAVESRTNVAWALENYGTVRVDYSASSATESATSPKDVITQTHNQVEDLRLTGPLTDHDGTYRAVQDGQLSFRPQIEPITFGGGSTIATDSTGTISFGRRGRVEVRDTSAVFTIHGTYDVDGTTKVDGTNRADVTIAERANLQDLGATAVVMERNAGLLTTDTTTPLSVGQLFVGPKSRMTVRSPLTAEGTMTLDDGRFQSLHDLTVVGRFDWEGGALTGSGETVASGGVRIKNGGTLDGRRVTIPEGASATHTGGEVVGRDGATIAIARGARLDLRTGFNWSGGSNDSVPPTLLNEGTLTKSDGGRSTNAWTLTNHGTLVVDADNHLRWEGPVRDQGGSYRVDGILDLWPDTTSIVFDAPSTVTVAADARLTYESDSSLTTRGSVDVQGALYAERPVRVRGGTVALADPGSITQGRFGRIPSDPATVLRLTDGGTLRGTGFITGNVASDSGAVQPGGADATARLTIQGDYRQRAGSSLDLELGGTTAGDGYDQLDAETVELDGTLRLAFLNGYAPGADDLLRPLRWSGTRTGRFATIDDAETGDVTLAVEYRSGALRVFDGSLPDPPAPELTVSMQAPPFARAAASPAGTGGSFSVTQQVNNPSSELVLQTLDQFGGITAASPFASCTQQDNYEYLKCRMGRFGITPPEPPEGKSYPRLTTERLFSPSSGGTGSATKRDVGAKTTTRMALLNGTGPVAQTTINSCPSAGEQVTTRISLGDQQATETGLVQCAFKASELVLSFTPGLDCLKLGAGISIKVASGFYSGSFDLPGYLSSQVYQAAQCGGDLAGFGTLVQIVDKLNDVAGKTGGIKGAVQQCIPDPSTVAAASDAASTTCVAAVDPNDKRGLSGVAAPRYIAQQDSLPYTVFFENKPDATAPAQDVVISDTLDTDRFDLSSFSFGTVTFGDTSVAVPEDTTAFRREVDLRPARDLRLRIEGTLDATTGVLTWTFTSLNPETGAPPSDPLAGFLPPNDNPPEGEGSVSYFADLAESTASGAQFGAAARIVFDENAPIDTPVWSNVLDVAPPSSQVEPLDATQDSLDFTVTWGGSDAGSGLKRFRIMVSANGGPYTPWIADTTATAATFTGQRGVEYAFYSVAEDALGNAEPAPSSADASTVVSSQAVPVELTAFTAQVDDESVRLSWTTASETDNAGFEVQRRRGTASSWQPVGFVDGHGTTTATHRYAFTDRAIPFEADSLRYRLRQIDTDGDAALSEAVAVTLSAPEQLALHGNYPNPFADHTTIRYEVPEAGEVRIAIFDMIGRQIRTLVDQRQDAGRRQIRFDARGLSSGVYFVRLTSDGRTATHKLTVVR